jgi:tetratricopeptide (TPR) repeat protein
MAIASAQPPYLSEMYHHLGQVFGYNREFEKSIEALQKAFDYNNENIETLFEIATTYEEFKSDKNFALKAYSNYVKRAGDKAPNAAYSLQRIKKIKEDLFVVNK